MLKFSVTEENYIKGIYHLQQQNAVVSTNLLAAELQTKAASVTDMLKKLQLKKILQYEKYKGFRLNAVGIRIALGIVRRHRLWEYFLVTKLGFDWDKVHVIAEELEHVSSEELISKLDNFLDFPQTDPHGDPIPDSTGKIPVIQQRRLAEIDDNKSVIVSSVNNQSPEMLEMLNHYQIGIGSQIKINRHFEFDGSVEIKVFKKPVCTISKQVANNINVHYEAI